MQLRLALAKVAAEGGEGAPAFRERFAEDFTRFDEELKLFRQTLGDDIVDWLDSRWGSLLKAVYSKKKIAMFVDDEEVGTFLYDEGLRFGTAVPDHREVAGGPGQAGAAVRGPPRAQARSGQEEDHFVGRSSPPVQGCSMSREKSAAPFGAEPRACWISRRRSPRAVAAARAAITDAARAAAPLLAHAAAGAAARTRSRR